MSDNPQCLQAQFDEIEALQSIYGDAWKIFEDSPGSYAIDIHVEPMSVSLYLHLSSGYPLHEPPTYTMSAPSLTTSQKHAITNILEEEYLNNVGESVLYQWIEKIRDYLGSLDATSDSSAPVDVPLPTCTTITSATSTDITHGEVITDKKSTFQGHVAKVTSVQQVHDVLSCLKSNRKICNATHNIYAYRISLNDTSYAQDCDDDGEAHAGGRLLHLLQIVNVTNVVVVVSRWYGGILLGPDRFRHINNAARQALQAANLISPSKGTS